MDGNFVLDGDPLIQQPNEYKKEFILKKNIRGSLHDRTVVIRHYTNERNVNLGRCILIYSKNKILKDKNIIPLFMENPVTRTFTETEKSKTISLNIRRKESSPVILTSNNELLILLLYKEICEWIDLTHTFKYKLFKWSDSIQHQWARCIHTIQTQKYFKDEYNLKNKNVSLTINSIKRRRAHMSLRYISYILQFGVNGHINMKREFFNMWLKEWNKLNLSVYIKNKHSEIQNKLNIFQSITVSTNNVNRHVNNVDDIHEKLNSLNTEFEKITSNLSYNTSISHTEDSKEEVVTSLQKIADLRHHIQSINNNEEEFVLIGDQSSGKSSLLCMLLGVNIAYTDNDFATRCPVRYLLEPVDPKMGWKYEFEDPRTKIYSAVSLEELIKRMIKHFKGTIGKQIVFEPINIRIKSPICTSSMTLVDLPGLVGISDRTSKIEQHKTSYALVKEYLNKPNIFILFVHRFDVDIGSLNTQILEEVKTRNKDNVIYCLTHFDRYCVDKDITYDNIYQNILQCSNEVANNNTMFLLSLSKKVEDLKAKESLASETIDYLKKTYSKQLEDRNIHFNVDSIKIYLRNKLHKHVLEIHSVLHDFLEKQKFILHNEFNIFNDGYLSPQVNEQVLDTFLTLFRNKVNKLLKGHLIPNTNSGENVYFETLKEEVYNANCFVLNSERKIWPDMSLLRSKDISGNNSNVNNITYFESNLDPSLKRNLVSHALFTRTVYELQQRLCSVNVKPSKDDILHGITYDPNINLDTPKDSAHCVMVHTIQRQLRMYDFFDYTIKRLEYICYKIIKYAIWNIVNSKDTPMECITLLKKEEFQQIFEIEIYNYIHSLCEDTRNNLIFTFDEIVNSPIVMSHAERYKDMLKNDFEWSEEDIDACYDENIFKPKNIGVHNKNTIEQVERDDEERIDKIRKLIKLHIHVRLLMLCEHMTMNIDFNWRRMLDNTKESTIFDSNIINHNIFSHIHTNVCKNIVINDYVYNTDTIHKLYNGNIETKIVIDQSKITDIESWLENLNTLNQKLPELLHKAVEYAGDKFL